MEQMDKVKKVIIYEDKVNLRNNICHYLESISDIDVVGDYGNCLNILKDLKITTPDIIVMDIDMPGINGVEGVKLSKESNPDIQIIMYTVFEDDHKLFQSLCAGADGYILKKSAPHKLVEAIRDVYLGGVPLSPEIARRVMGTFRNNSTKEVDFHLTNREHEILGYLTHGFSYKEIGSTCNITIDTVKKHIQGIYMKLHVKCGTEAVAKALKYKIVHY